MSTLTTHGPVVVVFASVAATFGAFFIESRAEKAAAADAPQPARLGRLLECGRWG